MKVMLRRIFYERGFLPILVQWAENNRLAFYLVVSSIVFFISYKESVKDGILWVVASLPMSYFFIKINDIDRSDMFMPAPPGHIRIDSIEEAKFWRPVSFLFFLSLFVLGLIADGASG